MSLEQFLPGLEGHHEPSKCTIHHFITKIDFLIWQRGDAGTRYIVATLKSAVVVLAQAGLLAWVGSLTAYTLRRAYASRHELGSVC